MHIQVSALSFQVQNILEMGNFSLQLLDDGIVSCHYLIGLNFLKDHLGPICKLKRRNGFLRVIGQRAHSRDQRGFGVAAQAVLQETRELRVTVCDELVGFWLCKRLNNLAEATQRQVDSFELKHMLLRHPFIFVNFFAAGQITEVEFRLKQHPAMVLFGRLDLKLENRVRSGRMHI